MLFSSIMMDGDACRAGVLMNPREGGGLKGPDRPPPPPEPPLDGSGLAASAGRGRGFAGRKLGARPRRPRASRFLPQLFFVSGGHRARPGLISLQSLLRRQINGSAASLYGLVHPHSHRK